ncbi:MAG: hypothetical protein Q7V16_00385 [Hydrogenophaga sp.]|jgi:hypothetical protein|nr:hypothetical protein [Hydrogenophaga sp.]
MAKAKSRSEERTAYETNIEAGLAAFQSLRSAKEERSQSLIKLVEPYLDGIREALERGVSKRAVLSTLNRLIGHSLNAKKLDELLGGGTMRSKSKGGASSLIGANATQTVRNEGES